MKKIAVLIVLLTSFFLTAMSDSPKDELKKEKIAGTISENQAGNGFITQVELNNIAVNYYKFMYEEEHEWKGMNRKEGENAIKNIIPVKEDDVTIAYVVNYNPDGHVMFFANKKYCPPYGQHGTGVWNFDLKGKDYLSSLDQQLHPIVRDVLHRAKKAIDEGVILGKEEDLKLWLKYNVPIEDFKERLDYENNTYQPDWWLEKKKSKNTQGLIKTEWYQNYPFNIFCPVTSDTTLVGCSPLAMAQLMKYYSYPANGLEDFSSITYDWSNMLSHDSLMTTQAQREAVARICADAGTAVNATYGLPPTGTSVYFDEISAGFSRYFNYTAQLKTKAEWYSTSNTDEWVDSLISSIGRNEPIIYGGLYSDASFSGTHTWIINHFNSGTNDFHFNMGWEPDPKDYNDWYPASVFILASHFAVFDVVPDKNEDALSIPYKEDFQGVDIENGSGIFQIPKNIGVSHTLTQEGYMTMFMYEFDTENRNNAIKVRNSGENNQWFVVKKINLACDSVPVLKFKYNIQDASGLVDQGTDEIIIEVSNDNRVTWNQIYALDKDNYKTSDFNKFVEKITSLNQYKNQIVNIRFRFPYSGANNFCFIDDIEVGKLDLKFTELVNDTIMPPRTAQPIKVTPSISLQQKSKGFDDYDIVMDYYIKKDMEEPVTKEEYPPEPNFTDSICENGIFEYPDWNTDDSLGVTFKIRAVARAKSDNTTLTSTEVKVKISGRECRVDLPLPATESWFDFETRLSVSGSILAEPALADSLDNVYVFFNIFDDYWSNYCGWEVSVFDEFYYDNNLDCDSNAYFCYFTKDMEKREYRPNKPVISGKPDIRNSMKILDLMQSTPANSTEKNTKDLTVYPVDPYRYPTSLNLYPGTYTVYMMAIRKDLYDADGTISEIAKGDSMQFIIPYWKMKLRRDMWYAAEVPYREIKEYEAGRFMQILFWVPWEWGPYNLLNLNIVKETDNVTVKNFSIDFNSKSALVQWDIPSETEHGFYNILADNLDYHFNVDVKQNILTQICPMYLSWENSGAWPNIWPLEDNDDWEMHPAKAWTPAMGAYALGAKYDTEGNTGKVELSKSSFEVSDDWDTVCEFSIGLEKAIGATNFDPLLADYSIASSTDGANWTIEKSAAVSDYTSQAWGADSAHCFIKNIKTLGKITQFGVKFIKKGIVTAPPDSQIVLFDEVKVVYTKVPLKDGPTNPQASYAGGNVSVSWGSPAKGIKALDEYYVYRNGIKIGETTSYSLVDSTASADTFYNYAITAHYDDVSLYPESPMNKCSVNIYTGLFAPSNLVITNENPNIKLAWSPVSGASEYKVYSSNDPYGTFAEDTSGSFDGEEWIAPLSSSRLFYYVVAVNESMKEKKILKETLSRVK